MSIWLFVSIPVVIIFLVLMMNHANLSQAPGIAKRLQLFLTTHKAEVRRSSLLPELVAPHYALSPEKLADKVALAMQQLGWQQIQRDAKTLSIKAVVVTALWRFKDDVQVQFFSEGDGSYLEAVSESRIGKGDLAANSAHLQALLAQLAQN